MGWLSNLFRKKSDAHTVRFYDFETKEVIDLPRVQLKAGLVQANVEGVEGVVWVDTSKLKQSPIRDITFDQEITQLIGKIRDAFAEHRPISITEWEDGFKRDRNPEKEIALWLYAAETYEEFAPLYEDAAIRAELYDCIIACLTTGRNAVFDVFNPQILPRPDAEKIIARFFNGSG